MVSSRLVASCLVLVGPAQGFVRPFVTRVPGSEVGYLNASVNACDRLYALGRQREGSIDSVCHACGFCVGTNALCVRIGYRVINVCYCTHNVIRQFLEQDCHSGYHRCIAGCRNQYAAHALAEPALRTCISMLCGSVSCCTSYNDEPSKQLHLRYPQEATDERTQCMHGFELECSPYSSYRPLERPD